MGKREKILVTLMALALVYAGFELVYRYAIESDSDSSETQVEPEADPQVAQRIVQEVEESKPSQAQELVLRHTTAKWDRNPFYVYPEDQTDTTSEQETEPEPEAEGVKEELRSITYSSYLETGDHRVAILDSRDYKVGDKLQNHEAVLKSISPQMVLLESLHTGDMVSVPFQGY